MERVDDLVQVSTLLMKGRNPTQIAKEIGKSRATVLNLIAEWKEYAQNDQDVMARASETLMEIDEHFGLLIQEGWKLLEQADNEGNLVVKNQAINTLKSLTADRAKAFRDAGLDNQGQIIAQMNETERKHEILIKVVREVVNDCAKCRPEVRRRLAEFTGRTEVVEVHPIEHGDV